MENGSVGSVVTFNTRNVTDADFLIAKSHKTRRNDDSTPTTASDNDHNDNDDDDVLSSVLLQIHHAYILPHVATSTHGMKRQQ